MRAFLGIALTTEAQTALSNLQGAFHMRERALRWVKPAQMHLTLKFLGEITEPQKQSLSGRMRSVVDGHACFYAELDRLGGFPLINNPKVLWMGMAQGASQISALALAIDQASAALGFKPEEKRFHPHITLARIESPVTGRKVGEKAKNILWAKPAAWRVEAVNLYRSILGAGGSRYKILEEFSLAGRFSST